MVIVDTQDINADAEAVWDLTVDVEHLPDLTPTVTSVERLDRGPVVVGSRARLAQPRLRPRVWTVTVLEAPRRFVWETRLGPVKMAGGHVVEPTATGCRNTLSVTLSGPGSRLLGLVARRPLVATLRTENEGFRRVAEHSPGVTPG